jgi:5-methylcytosine-specific restriction protein A
MGPCHIPGCPERAIKSGLCPSHWQLRNDAYEARRGTPAERGYGYQWQQLRRRVLSGEPLCVDPFGRHRDVPVVATDVDHIVARDRGGDDSIDNLQPLCHACHSRKTATRDGRWGR